MKFWHIIRLFILASMVKLYLFYKNSLMTHKLSSLEKVAPLYSKGDNISDA